MEKDLIKNAEYVISYFNQKGNSVTNLMLQKLMYFLEAIYMVLEDKNELFEEEFYAWDFGAVNDKLYQKYKEYGNGEIIIDKKIIMDKENEKFIDVLYESFKNYNSYNLVALAYAKGSTWYNLYQKFDGKIPKNTVIDKIDTKNWFKGLISHE